MINQINYIKLENFFEFIKIKTCIKIKTEMSLVFQIVRMLQENKLKHEYVFSIFWNKHISIFPIIHNNNLEK